MSYSSTTDLLTGNIPTPGYLDPQKFVDDAADEIDSKIGFVYETPIDVTDTSAVVRPARLLLKRINNFLATGRLLMAAAASAEDSALHAYARNMVDSATEALDAIFDGSILLEGAVLINPPSDTVHRGPEWFNPDTESAVDAFYDHLVPTNFSGSRVNGGLWGVESFPRFTPDAYPRSNSDGYIP